MVKSEQSRREGNPTSTRSLPTTRFATYSRTSIHSCSRPFASEDRDSPRLTACHREWS